MFLLWGADCPRIAACRDNIWLYSLTTSKKGQSEIICRGRERGKGEHRGKRERQGEKREREKREEIKEGGMERVTGSILSLKA